MSNKSSSKGAVTTGVIAAIAASSCCIPPIIAAIAGVGGMSSSLSWMAPLRPYLIGLAIIAIGYAWFVHFKSKSKDDCGCSLEKPKFYQTKGFLIGMTLFAGLSISFPYFSNAIYGSDQSVQSNVVTSENSSVVTFNIKGMTCESCENHINHALSNSAGVLKVSTSYAEGVTVVNYDASKTNEVKMESIIQNKTGYLVVHTNNEKNGK